jgi:tetratricopeptide (TPR) repeat protein
MGRGFSEIEIKCYKANWEKSVEAKRRHRNFPPAHFTKTERSFDTSGNLTQEIIKEISYPNGLAPDAIDKPLAGSTDTEIKYLLEETKSLISGNKNISRMNALYHSIEKRDDLGVQKHSILARICLAIGDSYYHADKYADAESNYNRALEYAEKGEEPEIIGICYYELGSAIGQQGRHIEAIKYFEKLSSIGRYKAVSLLSAGMACHQNGQYDRAIKTLTKSIRSAVAKREWFLAYAAYTYKALTYENIKNFRKTRESCLKAIKYARKSRRTSEAGFVFCLLGISNNMLGKHKEAISAYKRAISCRKGNILPFTIIKSCYNIGTTYMQLNRYKLAVKYLMKAIPLAIKEKDWESAANAYYNIAVSNESLGNYNEHIRNYKKAIKYGKKANNLEIVSEAYYWMADSQFESGSRKAALISFRNAVEYGKKAENLETVAGALWIQGFLEAISEKYDLAAKLFRESAETGKKVKDYSCTAGALLHLGNTQWILGHLTDAIKSFRGSIFYGKKDKNYGLIGNAFFNIASIRAEFLDYDATFDCLYEAIEYGQKGKDEELLAKSFTSLGDFYDYFEMNEDAFGCYLSACTFRETLPDRGGYVFEKITFHAVLLGLDLISKAKYSEARKFSNIIAFIYLASLADKTEEAISALLQKLEVEVNEEFRSHFNKLMTYTSNRIKKLISKMQE